MFLDSHGFPIETVEAKENDNFMLSCSSNSSEKSKLYLQCINDTRQTLVAFTPKVEIKAKRSMDGKGCRCYSRIYQVEKSIRLDISCK